MYLAGPWCVVTVLLSCWSPLQAQAPDPAGLLEGVSEVAAPGIPGGLCVFGDAATPLVAGSVGGASRCSVAAAARLGQGRVVAFGHDGYFDAQTLRQADTGRLMLNLVRWAAGNDTPRVAVVGQPGLLDFLRDQGLAAESVEGANWTGRLFDFQAICLHPGAVDGASRREALSAFIAAGGGALLADTGWGWLQLHPGKTLTRDHAGTQLLAPAGICWNDAFLERTSPAGFQAATPLPGLIHVGRALDALEAQGAQPGTLSKEQLAQAAWVVTDAARNVPPGDELILPRLRRLREQHAAEAVPTPDKPLRLEQALARLALSLQLQELQGLPPEQTPAHPAADSFPGPVPAEAPRVTRTLQVDTRVPDWHSTGLYAAPGEVVRVTVPPEAAGKGLTLRIGCHNDGLWHHEAWRRAPEICRRFGLEAPVTSAASAFGGLVYVEVPRDCHLGTVQVEVAGAVEAPHFVLGRTDPDQWRTQLRDLPAPWAELETSKVILTVPSTAVRGLDNPVPLLEFWVHVVDSCAELAAQPLERARPERYVTDVQISAGYMHSGYPIMTHLDVATLVTDLPRLLSEGSWGHFHEMGHNHQSGDWTFEGTGEVTVNLFSLYVLDRCCRLAQPGHPAITGEERLKKTRAHLTAGAPFEKWQADPFLGLIMYIQLQEAFGWEAYRKVFAEYRALPESDRPRTDAEKRDQWLVRFSRTVGRNLGPFFQAWGIPTSDAARASVASLPGWMPDGFPPAEQ